MSMQLRFASRAFLIGQRFLWFIWNWNCSNLNGLTTRLYCGTFCMRKWTELFSAQLRIVDIPTRIHISYVCTYIHQWMRCPLCSDKPLPICICRRHTALQLTYIHIYKTVYIFICIQMYDDYKWEISVAQLDFGIESSHLHLPRESQTQSAE